MHVRSWLGSGDFLHCGTFLPWTWRCMWSAAFYARTVRCRPPARSPLTNSRNEVQLFVQTHGLVHLRNVQAHSSSRSIRAMQDQATVRRSRSPAPGRSRVRLTPGPHGQSEDEDDWGEWTQTGLRTQDDRRRPRSPSIPPVRQVASATVDLIHLPVRNPVPSLGSHRFVLRSGSRIDEIAIMIEDVL